jgi:hypothetical protein
MVHVIASLVILIMLLVRNVKPVIFHAKLVKIPHLLIFVIPVR